MPARCNYFYGTEAPLTLLAPPVLFLFHACLMTTLRVVWNSAIQKRESSSGGGCETGSEAHKLIEMGNKRWTSGVMKLEAWKKKVQRVYNSDITNINQSLKYRLIFFTCILTFLAVIARPLYSGRKINGYFQYKRWETNSELLYELSKKKRHVN